MLNISLPSKVPQTRQISRLTVECESQRRHQAGEGEADRRHDKHRYGRSQYGERENRPEILEEMTAFHGVTSRKDDWREDNVEKYFRIKCGLLLQELARFPAVPEVNHFPWGNDQTHRTIRHQIFLPFIFGHDFILQYDFTNIPMHFVPQSTRICLKVCALPCYSTLDWLIEWTLLVLFPFFDRKPS